MKKNILTVCLAVFGCLQLSAVPIIVNNETSISPSQYQYDINTYLGILEDGNPCGATVGLYYHIPLSNPNLVLLDGTTVWGSPWNSTNGCISEYLGYSNCLPVALDHNGQRVGYSNFLNNDGSPATWNDTNLEAGMLATTEDTIGCHPNMLAQVITSTSYLFITPYQEIKYERFGNALATITYR